MFPSTIPYFLPQPLKWTQVCTLNHFPPSKYFYEGKQRSVFFPVINARHTCQSINISLVAMATRRIEKNFGPAGGTSVKLQEMKQYSEEIDNDIEDR